MEQTRSERAAQERKDRIEKYFNVVPDTGDNTKALVWLGVAAVCGLIMIVAFVAGSGFLGVVTLLAGGWTAVKGTGKKLAYNRALEAATPRPGDREMDGILGHDLLTVTTRAMERLGLTESDLELVEQQWDPIANLLGQNRPIQVPSRPLIVFGPIVPSRAAIGDDGIWRFSAYEVMVICPTGYHLAMYRCALDFLTGGLRQEETQEYHYSDVVAVSTTSSPGQEIAADNSSDDDLRKIRFAKTLLRKFQIVVASGDRSQIVVGIADEHDPERQASLQESGIDMVIGSVRRMLREKKGGVVPPRSNEFRSGI